MGLLIQLPLWSEVRFIISTHYAYCNHLETTQAAGTRVAFSNRDMHPE